MRSCRCRCALISILPAIFLVLLTMPGSPAIRLSLAEQQHVSALYLLTPPSDYKAFQDLVLSYRDSGANTLIIRPVSIRGSVDKQMLAKAVFFAHTSGMRLFVILPTRGMSFLLDDHPDWEDMYYNVNNRTVEPAGKLDLFNPSVTVYLSDLFRDIAGYSVDGILLDEDFYYGDTEGLSDLAMARYKKKYGSSYSVRSELGRLKGDALLNHQPEEYGEGFWNLAELKKNTLLVLLKNIMQSSRSANKEVKFGIALHIPGLFLKEKHVLAWYAHDMSAFKKMDINYFWLVIPHRDIRAQQDINYKKSIEAVARMATSSLSVVNDPGKVIIAVQAFSSSGKALPLTEIEEVSAQAKKAGDPGIAFMVEPDTQLPPELTKKIFKHQQE
jgi:hypothetical protein